MQFDRLGPYKIGKRLGRGGMGAVFEGVNVDTHEPAAVKVLNPHLAEDEGFRERFEMEIETLKKLKHPNIVRMFGYGKHEGYLYYVMELVRGPSVEEELQMGRRFTWREVVQYSVKLCKALRHAHDHGVIHRDIKPANLLLSEADNDIKLTDFGIARLFGNNRLTMDGALVGTAEYMSPEQAAGERVTPQSDLYSLGGVMFAMLAGRPPFRTSSLPEMLQKQRFEAPPPLSRYVTGIPPELEEFVNQLLSKDPQARAPNALVLSRQLAAMEHGLSIVRPRPAEAPTKDDISLASADRTVSDRPVLPDPHASTRAAASVEEIGYDPNAPTLLAAAPLVAAPAPAADAPQSSTSVEATAGASLKRSAIEDSPDVAVAAPPTPQATIIENRFTTVEEDERQRGEQRETSDRVGTLIQISLLTLSLAMIIGALWYFTRPPSADKLFGRIESAARESDPAALMSAEDDVKSFLERFPDDKRTDEVKQYQEEINLQRLEQRFRLRVRLLTKDESLTPVEHDYLEAMNALGSDPERTIQKLQAIVDLYGRPSNSAGAKSEADERTGQMVELARRQLQQLREQTTKSLPQYRALIDANLRRAELLRQTSPEQAKEIWRSIVTLYGDKPWAAAQVATAKAALGETGSAETADGRK